MKQRLLQVGLIFLLSLSFLSFGCKKLAQSTAIPLNQEYRLELLFEHEGIKVYRFWDGNTVYFTDARGATSWDVYHSTGKSGYTTHERVETVR